MWLKVAGPESIFSSSESNARSKVEKLCFMASFSEVEPPRRFFRKTALVRLRLFLGEFL